MIIIEIHHTRDSNVVWIYFYQTMLHSRLTMCTYAKKEMIEEKKAICETLVTQ